MTTIKRFIRKLTVTVKDTGEQQVLRFVIPAGYSLTQARALTVSQLSQLLEPIPDGVVPGTDCGMDTPPPQMGDPILKDTVVLPNQVAGTRYSFALKKSDATPFAGQTITGFSFASHPYLSMTYYGNSDEFRIEGNVPASPVAQKVVIGVNQSDLRFSLNERTIGVSAVNDDFYVSTFYFESGKLVKIRLGADTQSTCTVRLVQGPAGFNSNTYSMTNEAEDGTPETAGRRTYKVYLYSNVPPGYYVAEVIRAGVKKYATFTVSGNQGYLETSLTDTIPDAGDSLSAPVQDADALRKTRRSNLTIVASGLVEVTPPFLIGAAQPAFEDTGLSGGTYLSPGQTQLVPSAIQYQQIARLKGKSLTKTIQFLVPFDTIQTIRRKFVPDSSGGGIEYYLIRMQQWQDNKFTIPVWRTKNKVEDNFRSVFGECYDTFGQFADYNEGFYYFAQANVAIDGIRPTLSVWQIKARIGAPDSENITLEYTYGPQGDPGTQVYSATGNAGGGGPVDADGDFGGIYQA